MMSIRRSLAELQAEEHRALTRLSALAREGAELFIQPGENEHKAKESLLGRSDEPATLAGQRPIALAEATDLASEAPSLVRAFV